MSNERQFNLGEAIKRFYKIEPLKRDLTIAVANRVFEKQKNTSTVFDTWLYFIISLLAVGSLFICYSLLSKLAIPLFLLLLIVLLFLAGLSVKEFYVFSKKISN